MKRTAITLRAKTLALISLVLAVIILLLYVMLRLTVLSSFADLEREDAEHNSDRVHGALNDELSELESIATDWAAWDDMYAFVQNRNEAFIESNFDEAYETFRLTLILVLDQSGQVVYGQAFDWSTPQMTPLAPETMQDIASRHQFRFSCTGDHLEGILLLPEGPVLFAAEPIITSHYTGPVMGTLIFGRSLDAAETEYLSQSTALGIDVQRVDAPQLPADFQEALAALSPQAPPWIKHLDQNTIASYRILYDLDGQPALILRVSGSRDIYQYGNEIVVFFMVALVIVGVILAAVVAILLERLILVRLAHLTGSVRRIGLKGDLAIRVPVRGKDELALLAQTINGTLDALSESRARLDRVISSISDSLYMVKLTGKGCVSSHWVLSKQLADLTGYPLENFAADWSFWQSLVHPDDVAAAQLTPLVAGQGSEVEYRVITARGEVLWVRDSRHVELDPSDQALVAYGVISDITARKRAEEALRDSQQMLQLVMDSVPQSIFWKDLNLTFMGCNSRFAADAGLSSPEELIGKDDFDLIWREHAEEYRAADRQVLESGVPQINLEVAEPVSDGTLYWARKSKVPLHDSSGHLVGLLGIFEAITDRKRAEESLRFTQFAMDHAVYGVAWLDSDAKFTYVNDAFCQLLGYTRDELLAMHVEDIALNHVPPPGLDRLARLRELGSVMVEWHCRTKDGRVFQAEAFGNYLEFEGKGYGCVFVRDITDRKQAEEDLRFARFAMDRAVYGVVWIDSSGKFTYANNAYCQMLGYTRDELLAMHVEDVSLDHAPPLGPDRLVRLKEISPMILESRHQAKDGRIFPVEVFGNYLEFEGKSYGCLFTHDITARKQAEEELRQAHDELERRVEERTAELAQANTTLAAERNLLRTLIDNIPDYIYVKDTGSRFVLSNVACARFLRSTPDGLVGQTDFDFFPHEHAARAYAEEQQVIQMGQPLLSKEGESIDETGSQRWALTTKVPLRDNDGQIIGIVGISHDITGRRQIEDELRQARDELEIRVRERTAELSMANEALSESEERFRSAFEDAAVGMALVGPDGTYLKVNDMFCDLVGYTSQELLSTTYQAITYPDDLGVSASNVRALVVGEVEKAQYEKRYVHKQGHPVWVQINLSLVRDAQKSPLYLIAQVQNVTERRQAEKEHELLLSQMEARIVELATVAEVSIRAATIQNTEQFLWEVCDRIKTSFDLYHAHIYLLDDEGENLVLAAGAGQAGWAMVARGHSIPFNKEHSLVARAARDGSSVIANDVAQTPDFMPNELLPDTRSEMAVPLVVGSQVIGVLDVQSDRLDRFAEEDARVKTTLAAQIAIAIQNARLFAENQRRLAIIENSADLIALASLEGPPYYPVYINPAGLRLIGYDSLGEAVGHPIDEFYPSDSADYVLNQALPAALKQGMWRGETVLCHQDGARIPIEQTLLAIRDESGRPRDLALIATNITARKQAEVALHKANRAYQALSECSQAMVRATDEVRLLREVCQIIAERGGYRLVWVGFAQQDEAKSILHVAHAGYEEGYLDQFAWTWADQDLGLGPTGTAVRDGQPQICRNMRIDPASESWLEETLQHGYASFIALPLLDDAGQAFGVLNVYSGLPDAFDPEEISLLVEMASDLAFGIIGLRARIERQRAQSAERDQRILAEALRDTAAALNSTLNFDEVLDRILANIKRVVPHHQANIMLVEGGIARIVRYRGYAGPGLESWIRDMSLPVTDTPSLRQMAETRQPLAIPDARAFPGWANYPETQWIRSYAGAPILREGQVIGFLNLDSTIPRFFTQEHANRLQAFADQAAIAIENAQLYIAVQHHASGLELRVQQRTAELETQRGQLRAILDGMGEGVVFTVGTRLEYANQAYLDLLGYSVDELAADSVSVYESMTSTVADHERIMANIQESFSKGRVWRGEMKLRRRDGSEFDAALTITQVRSPDEQRPGGTVTIFRDISQEKVLQAQKDRFIANASHELRTPLANIKTRLYLIRRQPDKLQSHLEVLNRVTDTMAELIENLLDISRFERGVIRLIRRPVVLQKLITDIVAVQQAEAESHSIALVCKLPDTPLQVSADMQRMTQVITNLVANAINYTPDGGQVTVELDQEPETPGHPTGQAIVRVHDTGVGIAPDLLPQIFEPFFRANEGSGSGVGLGLTITREIVHLHGGEITAESEIGQGSVFTIEMDLLAAPEIES